MNVIRHKIWSDLWHSKGRTFQIVLTIAIGAFAIGMIIGGSRLIEQGMNQSWQASNPAMISLTVDPAVDEDILQSLESIRGVAEVEGYSQQTIEWRTGPEQAWQPADLTARDDYSEQQYTKLRLIDGHWPENDVLAVGQGADAVYGVRPGQPVEIRIDDDEKTAPVGGVVYDPIAPPPNLGGYVQFYATRDRFEELTGERDFNRILAGAAEYDEAHLTVLADQMQRRLEKLDIESGGLGNLGRISNPNEHFFQDVLNGLFLLLGVLAGLSLILGILLVYNTINATMSQQIEQIGIMKAIGARTGQILRIYLRLILVYGLLSLLLAVPLGAAGAYLISSFLISAFGVVPPPFTLVPEAILTQVAICLLAPLLASLIPLIAGARITVREAISTYGLGSESGPIARWLARLERVSRLVVLTFSNTFRRKGRVLLTQISLVISGLIFMMIVSVNSSVAYTYDDFLFSILRFNVSLQFEEPERISEVERVTLAHPQVKAVEMWALQGGSLRPAGQPESNDDERALLFGVPLPTQLYGPQLRAGRWLQPGDTFQVVLNQIVAEDAGVGVGDWITIDQNLHGESRWQVVGLLFDPIITNSAHVARATLLRETNSVNKASTVWIQTVRDDPDGEAAAAEALRDYYDEMQLAVSPQGTFGMDTASQITQQSLSNFQIILTLLGTMAVVIGLVGAIALSGVLSLNVMERRREIGVMRAIGATSGKIAGLLIGEGLILGWLSWLIALPLSIPAGYGITQALGQALGGEILYQYTPTGALYWLAIVSVLSIAASWLPARSAIRLSVRESLAYT